MTRWKTAMVALLAFLYPLAAGYCLLEKASLVTAIDCCAETTSNDQDENGSCGGYGCCPIEYAVYSNPDAGAVVEFVAAPPDQPLVAAIFSSDLPVEPPLLLSGRSPPEIPQSWQFSFRAALLPRAPSFFS